MKPIKSVVTYYSKGFAITCLFLMTMNNDFNFNLFNILEQSIYGAIGVALLIHAWESLNK
jgi:hypothetical protein